MFKKKADNKLTKIYKIKKELEASVLLYEEETKEIIEKQLKEAEEAIESILNNEKESYDEEKWEKTKKEIEEAREIFKKDREDVLKRTEIMLEKLLAIHFYPPEYIMELQMVKGIAVNIEFWSEKNPLIERNYENRIHELEKNIDKYIALHKQVVLFLEENKEKRENGILKIKDELTRNLQMGRLKEVEIRLKKLKKTL